MRPILFAALVAISLDIAAAPGYFRAPAIAGDTLVFTAEGDLWQIGINGGIAQRLTSHPAEETDAAVSPDGKRVAFVGAYEGPAEVYVMPIGGGLPKRLTWLGGGAKVVGWSPDDEVLFTSTQLHPLRDTRLAAVSANDAKQRPVPLDQASDGAYLDRDTLVFTRYGIGSDNVRAYRGGATATIWTMPAKGNAEAVALTATGDGNAGTPMAWKGRIAFLSDRDGVMNVWSMDRDGRNLLQHTKHKDFEVRSPSIAGSRVAYQHGADLRVINLDTGVDRVVPITLLSDFDQTRERWVRKPLDQFTSARFSRDGSRVVVTARGHVATAGIGDLRRIDVALPLSSRGRDAVFSGNGKSVIAVVDASGEEELWQFPADGSGPGKQLTRDGNSRRWGAWPSPDGKWIIHHDIHKRLWLHDIAAGRDTLLDDGKRMVPDHRVTGVVWAPDGSAFALSTPVPDNRDRTQVFLYRVSDRSRIEVTSSRYSSDSPVFSPDGKWLYFISRRHFEALNGDPWGDRNMGPYFDRRARLYAVSLQPDNRFPFQARDELEAPAPVETAPAAAPAATPAPPGDSREVALEAAKATPAAAKPKLPAIAWEGLAARLFEVPLPPANYTRIDIEGKRLWWLEADSTTEGKTALKSAAIDNAGVPPELFAVDVRQFELSADGKKLMFRKWAAMPNPGDIFIVDAAPKPPMELPRFQVRLGDWQFTANPREEWKQLLADAWRLQRDHFYDKDVKGVDWLAMRRKYEALLPRVSDRAELADLMAQMIAELSTLHSQVNPGDVRKAEENILPATLGVMLVRTAEGARIERILQGDPELVHERSPLARAEVNAKEGDTIVSVDGRLVKDASDISELLRGKAGKQALLTLRSAEGKSRQVIVKPMSANDTDALRLADWQWQRRKRVDEVSKFRYGYVHLRAMGRNDVATFAREFYPVADREGLIIDVRNNSGGNIDSIVIEKLMRRAWSYWQTRDGNRYWNQQNAFRGPIVVLANERTYSDGETFAEGMKRLGLATVIGKRTSGAGVWLSDRNPLADNGIARAAEWGLMGLEGSWLIEGVGVAPDVEVDNPPNATFNGADAQLDAAIRLLDEKLAAMPMPQPPAISYPRVQR